MTLKELENYILAHENTCRREIATWKYIRYTVFDSAFAAICSHDNTLILTVWGRFPQYEADYPHIITPASDNEPKHFTDIELGCDAIPEHVIKNMIDSAYRERLQAIIAPTPNGGCFNHIPYCGLASKHSEMPDFSSYTQSPSNDDEVAATRIPPWENFSQPEGAGKWNNIPYRATHSIEAFQKYFNLRKQLAQDPKDSE